MAKQTKPAPKTSIVGASDARSQQSLTGTTKVITITNFKGGVGKTTSAVTIATATAQMGHKTLLIDMDWQGDATMRLGAGEGVLSEGRSITKAISNELGISEVRLASNVKNLDVIGADASLAELRDFKQGKLDQGILINHLIDDKDTEQYEYIYIDTHGNNDCLFQSSLAVSHFYLVPLFAEAESLRGLGNLIQQAEFVKKASRNKDLKFLGCIITRFENNSTHQKFENLLKETAQESGFKVFDPPIPASAHVPASSMAFQSLLSFKPKSPPSLAYLEVTKKILKEIALQQGLHVQTIVHKTSSIVFKNDIESAAEDSI